MERIDVPTKISQDDAYAATRVAISSELQRSKPALAALKDRDIFSIDECFGAEQ